VLQGAETTLARIRIRRPAKSFIALISINEARTSVHARGQSSPSQGHARGSKDARCG